MQGNQYRQDRQTGQTDNGLIGRTVLQTVAQKRSRDHNHAHLGGDIHSFGNTWYNLSAVVKVRRNARERRSWAPYNCWRAFQSPTQPSLMVQERWQGPPAAYRRAPNFFRVPGPQIYTLPLPICVRNSKILASVIPEIWLGGGWNLKWIT